MIPQEPQTVTTEGPPLQPVPSRGVLSVPQAEKKKKKKKNKKKKIRKKKWGKGEGRKETNFGWSSGRHEWIHLLRTVEKKKKKKKK